MWMWHLGTWFSGGLVSAGLMVGLGDLRAFPTPSESIISCTTLLF